MSDNKGARALAKAVEKQGGGVVRRRVGISKTHLCLLQQGKRMPSLKLAKVIFAELNIPMTWWGVE
jgi:hypothetical protein